MTPNKAQVPCVDPNDSDCDCDEACPVCGEDPCKNDCHLGCPKCGGPYPDGCVCWEEDERVGR